MTIKNTNQKVSDSYRDNPFWGRGESKVVESSMTGGKFVSHEAPSEHLLDLLDRAFFLITLAASSVEDPDIYEALREFADEIYEELALRGKA